MNKVMQTLIFLSIVASTQALELDCQWMKSENHSDSFYRTARLHFNLSETEVILVEDTFLYRTYTPCWMGTHSSCAFGFTYQDDHNWTIEKQTPTSLSLSAPAFYWSAELHLEFNVSLESVQKNDFIAMTISGDDGDGVMINNEGFSCLVIQN